jgi:hypothetical protein
MQNVWPLAGDCGGNSGNQSGVKKIGTTHVIYPDPSSFQGLRPDSRLARGDNRMGVEVVGVGAQKVELPLGAAGIETCHQVQYFHEATE